MKVRYLLDLHLEFVGLQGNEIQKLISKIPSGMDEVCILSGDVGDPYLPSYDIFMKFISDNFKKTFVITGNHEYYNKTKTIDEINDYLREYYQQFDNITFLHNSYEIYENYCFIGTTLWTKIELPSAFKTLIFLQMFFKVLGGIFIVFKQFHSYAIFLIFLFIKKYIFCS